MSTRAVYIFKDDDAVFHVYKHSDGYPIGGLRAIRAALDYAWHLPRFEADEFAAAFVAANKSYWRNRMFDYLMKDYEGLDKLTKSELEDMQRCYEHLSNYNDGGGVRVMNSGPMMQLPGDVEFVYMVDCWRGKLRVEVSHFDHPKTKRLFRGTLEEAEGWAQERERQKS